MEEPYRRKIKSYVLRGGRMSTLQKKALEEVGGDRLIPYTPNLVDPAVLLGKKDVVAEIGFGMGVATAVLAEGNPQTGYLGIEVYLPGVGKLLSEIHLRKLTNLRIIRHDAVEVFQNMIPDRSLAGIHVFFPDPWPKKKHHKRRIIQSGFARLMMAKLREGGYIHAATDWEEYAEWMLQVFSSVPELSNKFDGYAESSLGRPETKFEVKGRNREHVIRDICFIKRA